MLRRKVATAAIAALMGGVGAAQAGQLVITHSGKTRADGTAAKFAIIRKLQSNISVVRGATVALPPTWVFSFSYGGRTYNETFVGTNPRTNSITTTVPVYLIPIRMTYGTVSYNPSTLTQNGVSIVQNVLNSPVFANNVTFSSGGVSMGTTQYLDAYQRGNLWGVGAAGSTYHVKLGTPVVTATQSLTVPTNSGTLVNQFGASNIILANINWFDPQIAAIITRLGIPRNALPLFITTQTYLGDTAAASSCCIGGYHTVSSSGQPYSHATFITANGAFAQDVSALSHEIGEWMDDPNINNPIPAACGAGGVLENGDPLENDPNYGTFTALSGGVTWHLQDLVYLRYFGAPATTSVGSLSTFRGAYKPFCSAGP